MPRKTVPIQTAADPQPQRFAAGKPPVPAEIEQRPADDGGIATGTTGGNFEMPDVAVGAGNAQTQQGIDDGDPNK